MTLPFKPQNGPVSLEALRHSVSHIMADAVLRLFPEGKVAIGPSIEHGFYYDFDLPRALTDGLRESLESLATFLGAEQLELPRGWRGRLG